MPSSALLHANAGGSFGMGHLMRCLAIAQHAHARGWSVRLVGDLTENAAERAARALPELRVERTAPGGLAPVLEAALAPGSGVDVVHLDTYAEDLPLPARAPRGGDVPVLSVMQDGPFGARPADLTIDGNLGAEQRFATPAQSLHPLAGASAAVIREQVLTARAHPRPRTAGSRVLVVLGGTDPFRVTPRVLAGLDRVPAPLSIRVIAPPDQEAVIRSLAERSPHPIEVSGFTDDLPAVASAHDLVISAAGTSVWDFACMGTPMTLVCVTENQRRGYESAIRAGIALGLGAGEDADLEDSVAALAPVLHDAGARRALAARGRELIDGLGTWRIVSAWESLIRHRAPSHPPRPRADLVARDATPADADLLRAWRNDPRTRAASRESAMVSAQEHGSWLRRALADPARRLMIVSDAEGTPLGTVRGDRLGDLDQEISITLAPEARGRGLSAAILAAGEDVLTRERPVRLHATIHQDNAASLRLFAGAGYLPHAPADPAGFASFARLVL